MLINNGAHGSGPRDTCMVCQLMVSRKKLHSKEAMPRTMEIHTTILQIQWTHNGACIIATEFFAKFVYGESAITTVDMTDKETPFVRGHADNSQLCYYIVVTQYLMTTEVRGCLF